MTRYLAAVMVVLVGCGSDDIDTTDAQVIVRTLTPCADPMPCVTMPTDLQLLTARGQCRAGQCEIVCRSRFMDCDGDPSNGCEVEADRCP